MTGTREPQQDGIIQAMLRDSGLEASAELRSSLQELRSLAPDQAPEPRADLAALLAAGVPGLGVSGSAAGSSAAATTAMPTVAEADHTAEVLPAGVTSLAERRGRKRRLAVVSGAVVGAMTLGAGAVAAASGDFRESINHTVGNIFQPSGETPDLVPAPAKPSPADIPAAPAPSKTSAATTPPTEQAVPQVPESAVVPAKPGVATPPAVGRGGVLPTPPQRPVTPRIPGLPGPGEERGLPANPLPEPPLPGVLPTLPAS
jgi:hypothetical protein